MRARWSSGSGRVTFETNPLIRVAAGLPTGDVLGAAEQLAEGLAGRLPRLSRGVPVK